VIADEQSQVHMHMQALKVFKIDPTRAFNLIDYKQNLNKLLKLQ